MRPPVQQASLSVRTRQAQPTAFSAFGSIADAARRTRPVWHFGPLARLPHSAVGGEKTGGYNRQAGYNVTQEY